MLNSAIKILCATMTVGRYVCKTYEYTGLYYELRPYRRPIWKVTRVKQVTLRYSLRPSFVGQTPFIKIFIIILFFGGSKKLYPLKYACILKKAPKFIGK